MGLLDDLLGSGQATGADRTPAAAPSGGTTNLMAALLPVVLAMLASRRSGTATQGEGIPSLGGGLGSGGLGSVLGALLGGSGAGSGMGGLGDLLAQFQRAGYGDQAQSWVGRGQNQPLPPNALEQIFGRGGLAALAQHAGVSEAEASRGLSQLLPEVVDHVTPDGREPDADALLASVQALGRRYGVA
jgi:uncharacterized protein YidB (DUF937 family)